MSNLLDTGHRDPLLRDVDNPSGARFEIANDTDSPLPNNPDEQLEFAVHWDVNNGNVTTKKSFTPLYYPKSFEIVTEKGLTRVDAGCEGQNVTIEELKNSDISISGKVHSKDLNDLHALATTNTEVEVLSPVLPGGGLDCVVKKTRRGQVESWDGFPAAQDWILTYKMDLVAVDGEYEANADSKLIIDDSVSDNTDSLSDVRGDIVEFAEPQ